MTTAPTDSITPVTWKSRIEAAAHALGKTPIEVEEGLKTLGFEEHMAGLELLSDEEVFLFGDLRKVFGDDDGIPIGRIRLAMKFLRGNKKKETTELDPEILTLKEKFGVKIKMENVDPSELLPYYHPEKPNHPVTLSLRKRFGNQAIIIFKPESKEVAVEETANYIADLAQGFPEQETVEVDGMLVRLYSVGKIPNQLINEDPLFPGQPLKRERSVVNRVNWDGINEEVRKFCRIIAIRGDIDTDDRFAVKSLIKTVSHAQTAMQELRDLFPEADLEYRERKEKDNLPKLRLTLEEANGNANNNPFAIKNRQY